jgi:arsenate reductase
MIKIYGIHNCDTMQKAIKWLDAKKVKYVFHNYKEQGIDKATLELWLKHLPVDKLINLRSTTFRELSEDERGSITNKSKAIALMMKYNSIIKRPVWDLGNGTFFLGWDEKEISKLLAD